MKIGELREIIEKYSDKQLRIIIDEIYKTLPKKVKEEKSIDDIIKNPDREKVKAIRTREETDIYELDSDLCTFISDYRNGYYSGPNRMLSKKERQGWRFQVGKSYNKIISAPKDAEDTTAIIDTLEQLYVVLCDAYGITDLTSSGDPFQAIKVSQYDYLKNLFSLKSQFEPPQKFIESATSLILNTKDLFRFLLYPEYAAVITEFLKTPDMKELCIKINEEKIIEVTSKVLPKPSRKASYSEQKAYEEFPEKMKKSIEFLCLQNLFCFLSLHEYEAGVQNFYNRYPASDKESQVYILLKILKHLNLKDLWLREYELAVKSKIDLRNSLRETYDNFKNE